MPCLDRVTKGLSIMDAITLLQTRNSVSQLCDPAPDREALDTMLRSALRAPDHARLRPWRFVAIRGDARHKLGQLFVRAAQQRRSRAGEPPMSAQEEEKMASKALRAPLIVLVIATLQEHPKVPVIEQLLSAGCAAHAILLAAQAQGFGGIWRTGANAYDATVKQGLGMVPAEEIVGYLYLGTVSGNPKPLAKLAIDDYLVEWEGGA